MVRNRERVPKPRVSLRGYRTHGGLLHDSCHTDSAGLLGKRLLDAERRGCVQRFPHGRGPGSQLRCALVRKETGRRLERVLWRRHGPLWVGAACRRDGASEWLTFAHSWRALAGPPGSASDTEV